METNENDGNIWGVIILLLCFVLIAVAVLWAMVGFHKADEATEQWQIWSKRCEQIVNLNAERMHTSNANSGTYFEGCPEGPRNEMVKINR